MATTIQPLNVRSHKQASVPQDAKDSRKSIHLELSFSRIAEAEQVPLVVLSILDHPAPLANLFRRHVCQFHKRPLVRVVRNSSASVPRQPANNEAHVRCAVSVELHRIRLSRGQLMAYRECDKTSMYASPSVISSVGPENLSSRCSGSGFAAGYEKFGALEARHTTCW
jgi:hypothetical protein